MGTEKKCKPEYLNYGITDLVDKGIVKPQCVICGEVLSNESFKDSKLKRHLQIKHSKLSDKHRENFQRKEQNLKKQRFDYVSSPFMCTLKQATLAYSVVS